MGTIRGGRGGQRHCWSNLQTWQSSAIAKGGGSFFSLLLANVALDGAK